MMHVRSFARDYWKALAAVALWFALLVSCYLVPDHLTYFYAMMWAGLATFVPLFFVLGYLRFSKPSKDPITHKRDWDGVWAWIVSQAAVVVLVVGLNFALRVINMESAIFNEERVMQYRFTAAVFVTVFLVQLWLAIMWTWRQVHTRRELREAQARDKAR